MANAKNLNKRQHGLIFETEASTGNRTLTHQESGKVFFLSNASGADTITLPSVLAGVNYQFYVTENTPTATITIAAGSAIIDLVMKDAGGNASNSTAGTAVSNIIIGTSATQGDYVSIMCDGTTWYALALSAIDDAITTS